MRLRLPGAKCLSMGDGRTLPVLDRPILLSVLEYCWWWPTNIHAREQSGLRSRREGPSPNIPRVKLFWRLKFSRFWILILILGNCSRGWSPNLVVSSPLLPSHYGRDWNLVARKATRQPPKTGAISPTGDCRLERILASYLRCASLSYRICRSRLQSSLFFLFHFFMFYVLYLL